MIIHINGHPGVGKLTIGRLLAEELGGKLLDNHSVYNVAFALTEHRSQAFFDTIRALRQIAYDRILELPAETPVVLTNAHFTDSDWGNACWDAGIDLARRRGGELLVVILDCAQGEHDRRIRSPERAGKRKLQDPAFFIGKQKGRVPIDRGGDRTIHLDVTDLTPKEAAQKLAAWVRTPSG